MYRVKKKNNYDFINFLQDPEFLKWDLPECVPVLFKIYRDGKFIAAEAAILCRHAYRVCVYPPEIGQNFRNKSFGLIVATRPPVIMLKLTCYTRPHYIVVSFNLSIRALGKSEASFIVHSPIRLQISKQ